MAEDPVRRRTRRAAKRIERQRRKALATPARKRAEVAITRADSTGTARPWLPRPATAAAKLAR